MIKAYLPNQIGELTNKYMRLTGDTPSDIAERISVRLFAYFKEHVPITSSVCMLCGIGTNGMNAFGLAELLCKSGYRVSCIISSHYTRQSATYLHQFERYIAAGGTLVLDPGEVQRALDMADVIVDAINSLGFRGDQQDSGMYTQLIEYAETVKCSKRYAIDLPCGIHPDNGTISIPCFRADATLIVTVPMIGLYSYPARAYAGEPVLIDTGIEKAFHDIQTNSFIPDADYLKQVIPPYGVNSNKGSHGKLLAIVGSRNMTGAAVMSISMALRSGVGLLAAASDETTLHVVKHYAPEPIYLPFDIENQSELENIIRYSASCSAILIGCGLGTSPAKQNAVLYLLLEAKCRVILDADGINLIAGHIDVLKEAAMTPILTPHPGEFARLTGDTIRRIESRRIDAAREFAAANRCVLVLKGAGTVIASPDGRFAVNASGTCGLAKGGSGDVLAGLIAGLAAQPGIDAFEAAVCGVYAHGKGAEVTASRLGVRGMLPSDAIPDIAAQLP